jgi:spore coat polysaccharide biosynthesis protein SpsF
VSLGKIGIVVAARTLSSRLPGKALLPLHGMPMIVFLLRRLRPLRNATLVLATTELAADDCLARLVETEGVPVFRGADADVVDRYVAAATRFGFDTVVRVTGDCPFVNAELVTRCLLQCEGASDFDLASTKGRFPVGLDAEIFSTARMAALHAGGRLTAAEREHLTLFFYNHRVECTIRTMTPPPAWQCATRHFTVDTQRDYVAACDLANAFDGHDFTIDALVARAGE